MQRSPRLLALLLFISSIFLLLAFRLYSNRLVAETVDQPEEVAAANNDQPKSLTCQQDSDCGQGFFCREGECSEYLYDLSCNDSSDCQLVNVDHGYSCCWQGACQPKNFIDQSWIAVNTTSYQASRQEFCPTKEDCGPAPSCPESADTSGVTAECQESLCVKVLPE